MKQFIKPQYKVKERLDPPPTISGVGQFSGGLDGVPYYTNSAGETIPLGVSTNNGFQNLFTPKDFWSPFNMHGFHNNSPCLIVENSSNIWTPWLPFDLEQELKFTLGYSGATDFDFVFQYSHPVGQSSSLDKTGFNYSTLTYDGGVITDIAPHSMQIYRELSGLQKFTAVWFQVNADEELAGEDFANVIATMATGYTGEAFRVAIVDGLDIAVEEESEAWWETIFEDRHDYDSLALSGSSPLATDVTAMFNAKIGDGSWTPGNTVMFLFYPEEEVDIDAAFDNILFNVPEEFATFFQSFDLLVLSGVSLVPDAAVRTEYERTLTQAGDDWTLENVPGLVGDYWHSVYLELDNTETGLLDISIGGYTLSEVVGVNAVIDISPLFNEANKIDTDHVYTITDLGQTTVTATLKSRITTITPISPTVSQSAEYVTLEIFSGGLLQEYFPSLTGTGWVRMWIQASDPTHIMWGKLEYGNGETS